VANDQYIKRKLLIVKRGCHYFTFNVSDIAFIYSVGETTYIIDKEGKKFFCSLSLNKIEHELDHHFFRANRQYIINIDYIRSFRIHEKKKLIIEMKVDDVKGVVQISQVTAPKFREWISAF